MLETQKVYEDRIGYNEEDRFKKKILALIVELGESVNERPSFLKYWSKNHKSSSQKNAEYYAEIYGQSVVLQEEDLFLEELVDMFSFILALGIEIGIEANEINLGLGTILFQNEDKVNLYLLFSQNVLNLYTIYLQDATKVVNPMIFPDIDYKKPAYNKLLDSFFALGISFGYTFSDIEQAYYNKNSVNHRRQSKGY